MWGGAICSFAERRCVAEVYFNCVVLWCVDYHHSSWSSWHAMPWTSTLPPNITNSYTWHCVNEYRIARNFQGRNFSWISQIHCHSQKYFPHLYCIILSSYILYIWGQSYTCKFSSTKVFAIRYNKDTWLWVSVTRATPSNWYMHSSVLNLGRPLPGGPVISYHVNCTTSSSSYSLHGHLSPADTVSFTCRLVSMAG